MYTKILLYEYLAALQMCKRGHTFILAITSDRASMRTSQRCKIKIVPGRADLRGMLGSPIDQGGRYTSATGIAFTVEGYCNINSILGVRFCCLVPFLFGIDTFDILAINL